MALINCPECGAEVSEKAPNCIKCGYPLYAVSDVTNGRGFIEDPTLATPLKKTPKKYGKWFILCGLLIFLSLIILLVFDSDTPMPSELQKIAMYAEKVVKENCDIWHEWIYNDNEVFINGQVTYYPNLSDMFDDYRSYLREEGIWNNLSKMYSQCDNYLSALFTSRDMKEYIVSVKNYVSAAMYPKGNYTSYMQECSSLVKKINNHHSICIDKRNTVYIILSALAPFSILLILIGIMRITVEFTIKVRQRKTSNNRKS